MTAHLERARLLISQRRMEMAEKELGLSMAQDPNNPIAHALLAFCLADRKQFETATSHARQAIGLGPDVPFTHYTLAHVMLARNRLEEAEAAAAEAIDLAPLNPDFHELLGRIRFTGGRWEAAKQSADEALALDPENVGAKNLRAEALRRLGRGSSAERELSDALKVDPDAAWTHANLGWTLLEKGDRDGAMKHFREALRLEPELDWARQGVVETLKAHNVFYRLFMQYFFFMARLSRGRQWTVILVAWLLYVMLGRLADSMPALKPWVMPLLVAYLVFVLGSWLAVPLANLVLRFHPFGRLALSREERTATNWIGGCLASAIASGVAWLIQPSPFLLYLSFFFLLMLLPLGATFQAASPWPRKGMAIAACVIALMGLAGVLRAGLAVPADIEAEPVVVVLFWLVISLAAMVFPYAAFLSLFLGNILISIRWKR